jgi:protocatechuate 3,4-dioxygenase beta subunit
VPHLNRLVAGAGLCLVIATLASAQSSKREPIIGGPCDGCEAVFEGLPPELSSTARIAPAGARGEPMRIVGTVRDRQGHPATGVIVYAYQTDAGGLYPQSTTRHGGLRGWVKTDASGRYQFDTIRPGGYPNTTIPQHVHMHVIEPGRATYYIDEMVFSDDPRLTAEQRKHLVTGRGGDGLVTPARDRSGLLTVTRDIVLGRNVPGYPR